jgi:MFS family permease
MDRPANRQARFFVALSLLVALLNSNAASPLYASYRAMWQLDTFTITLIFAIYAAGTLTALFVLGRLSDRLPDRRLLMIPSLGIIILGALIFGTAQNPTMLMIGRLLAGTGTGGLASVASAALIELDPKTDPRAGAVLATAVFTGGAALGPFVSSASIYFDVWPLLLPFIIIAVLAVIAAIGIMTAPWAPVPRAVPVAGVKMPKMAVEPGSYAAFAVAAGAVVIVWVIGSSFAALGVTFVKEGLKVESQAAAGCLIGAFQLIAGISQLASQKVDSGRATVAGTILITLSVLVCAIALWEGSPLFFGIGMISAGVGYGAAFVGSAGVVNRVAPPDRRATWVSAYYITAYLSNALPVLALGFLGDRLGLLNTFLCLTLFTLIGAIVITLAGRRALPPPPVRRR